MSKIITKIMPLVIGIILICTGHAQAADKIFYTQSYSPYELRASDLSDTSSHTVLYTSATGSPSAVAVDADNGCIFFSDPNPTVAKIFRANVDGTNVTTFMTGVYAQAIAIDASHGYIYYAQPQDGSVYRANLADGSGKTAVYTSGTQGAPRAVAVDTLNSKLYIGDYNLGK